MTRKNSFVLFFLLGISFLLSLCYCPPFDAMFDDREVFSYGGMAILKGLVPYRDFFDHKPPGIFFINAAGQLLGGGLWGLWVINMVLALLATGALYRICLQNRLHFPWLLPLLFNLMVRDNLVSLGAGMTREYTTYFFVLFFCIFMGKARFRENLLGLFTGLIFFTQQEQVLAVLPFLLYALLTERSRPVYLRIARIGLGFGLVLLPILFYFAWNHSLAYLWEDGFRFNMVWYTAQPKSLGDHFRTIKRCLDAGNYEVPFLIALVLGGTAFFLRHKRKGLLLAALAAFFLSLAPEMMGNRFEGRANPIDSLPYFLPLAGSVCALLFVVFAFSDDAILGSRPIQLPYALLLCCGLAYTALQHSTHLIRRSEDTDINSPALNYLRQHRPGNYELYVFNYDDYIYAYNEFRILAPSRWIYHHMWDWYDKWDTDHALLTGITNDLLRHHTTYIIMDTVRMKQFLNPANAEYWQSFMQTYYEQLPISDTNKNILWKRKDALTYSNR
ncbi:hypothetical protein [Puia sp.]|uniref:hypothetical protein n=1 Tax=Puia sp. TaxID=2045100 RepID=UPI002F41AC28